MDYISGLLRRGGEERSRKKRKQIQTVELKVRMDCDGCELKVKKLLYSLKGVRSVEVNRKQHKVTVRGYIEPNKVLKKARSTGKKAEIWPYVVPFTTLNTTTTTYGKKPPPGYVRNVEFLALPTTTTTTFTTEATKLPPAVEAEVEVEQQIITTMFSDDNPNACSIM